MSKVDNIGKLIVFEGPDGVGKSTLSNAFVRAIQLIGIPCEYLAFPGKENGTIGHLVYKIHHNERPYQIKRLTNASKQALHIAAHLDAIENRILPALQNNHWVVLDRYWWSTWVYGRNEGVDEPLLDALIKAEIHCWTNRKPDAVFLVNRTKNEEDNGIHNKLLAGYQRLYELEQDSYPIHEVLNNTGFRDPLIYLCDKIKRLVRGERNHKLRDLTAKLRSNDQQLLQTLLKKKFPSFYSKLTPAKPSIVYDSYWRFATERQDVFFRKLEKHPRPWTNDPILAQYKFTNAYRASDRVSQFLIKHVIYDGDQTPSEVFFRTILFKLFNKIETWKMLQNHVAPICQASYSFQKYDKVLSEALSTGVRIYSNAYIMPSGRTTFGHSKKHRNHLLLLERMMEEELPITISNASSMNHAFELLLSYPTIGGFLAYQFITDLNYSKMIDFSEMDFVVPGPGALDGIRKCFIDYGGLNETDIIRVVTDMQDREFERLGLQFRSLGGRPLQLIDCQNLFCEVSKYARVKHPEIKGYSDRSRIKQVYRPTSHPIAYWYPPKWKINHLFNNDEE